MQLKCVPAGMWTRVERVSGVSAMRPKHTTGVSLGGLNSLTWGTTDRGWVERSAEIPSTSCRACEASCACPSAIHRLVEALPRFLRATRRRIADAHRGRRLRE